MRLAVLLGAILALACGDDGAGNGGFSATLSDHPDAVTDQPGDNIAFLEVESADEDIPLNRLLATFEDPGGTATAYDLELSVDANADGLLGEGDTLLLIEPALDQMAPADVGGPDFDFTLYKELDGNRVETLHTEFFAPN
ncbi:MAG: hypothetical protein KJO07_05640 [Deltaproteobacteria bacterium]|nr:hypothetical protein [Deltaproteobacteria bacterium]